MAGLPEVISLAKEILRTREHGGELEEKLEQYSLALERWYKKSSAEPNLGLEQADLEELVKIHQNVLELAKEYRAETSQAMRLLKQRGKAVMTYATEGVPKRLSTIRTRKL